jgi:hypothetical protein
MAPRLVCFSVLLCCCVTRKSCFTQVYADKLPVLKKKIISFEAKHNLVH